jgi:hypothetical protein
MISLAITAALIALPGCGGGGGGGGGGGLGGNGGGNPATTLHTMAVGDKWQYTITGTATAPGQTSSNVSGTITRTIVSKALNGANTAIEEVSVFNFTGGGLNGGGGGGTTDTFFTQDANGNIIETGQESTPDGGAMTTLTTTSPAANNIIIPGSWAAGQNTQANITYSPAGNLTQSFDIGVGQSVTVPAGTFAAWNVNVSVNGGAASPQTWDPKMGSYLTNTFTQTADFGGTLWTITTTAKLTSSTVAG